MAIAEYTIISIDSAMSPGMIGFSPIIVTLDEENDEFALAIAEAINGVENMETQTVNKKTFNTEAIYPLPE